MEGAYKKVIAASTRLVAPEYAHFVGLLSGAIRSEIASCIEKAYPSIRVADAGQMLHVSTEAEVKAVANERGWKASGAAWLSHAGGVRVTVPPLQVKGDRFVFGSSEVQQASECISSLEMISNSLMYAKEMERIV